MKCLSYKTSGKKIAICLGKLLAVHTNLSRFLILMAAMEHGRFRFHTSASHQHLADSSKLTI